MNPPSNFEELVNIFIDLIKVALPVVAGAALLVFFWGLVKFIAKAGDAKNHEEGKKLMIWGIIALFVMLSFMGIISLVSSDLGFGGNIRIPFLPQ